MGVDLADLPAANAKFEQAEQILGWSVPEICQNLEEKLSQTTYTQPCLYTVSSILADLMLERGKQPQMVAGHSVGEYTALYVARVFDFEAGLRLVKRRAELMDRAVDGMMAALIGCDRAQLDERLQHTEHVVLANDNNPSQVVISGTPAAVQTVLDGIKAKRKVPLNVSGAFHSPLMAEAAAEFQPILDSVPFATAKVPVLSNVEPSPTLDAEVLKQRLSQQITGSVRWRETSLKLAETGVETIVEIGPGKVLTGLIKRTCSGIKLANVSSTTDLPNP